MKNPSDPELLAMEGVRFFGAMSASISHEIKNVLAIINENAGLLDDLVRMSAKGAPLDPERLTRVAASIARQVARGDGIVKGMNRFAHSADLPREAVDLAEVAAFMPDLAARLLTMRGSMPRIDAPQTPVVVETNRFFVENLFWNCLCQATAAADADQPVCISVHRRDGRAGIRFSGLDPLRMGEGAEVPDETQALIANLIGARVQADIPAGVLEIVFANSN